ncbi:DNA polymerase I [Gammaproteobacteria bacterium]|nr:DNA polymerase I [Gammaproteobacteria bacterium]MDA9834407.1 DNA polymerase I [Gammaproteobacteria bacterium]MDA9979549.1 DNA polymerase I [Gammaproteobacteria bacterium]MDC3371675.1 DNA polymerase I [Gammaproteobacteria bacterium]
MTNPNKKIFLIDGSSYLYRAFHAMPPLTTSTGLPTGAVKGVTNMLRNLRNENPNSHYLAIFDAKGKNFRHSIYKDYKANRPPMPPELREQLAPLKSICNAMGMPVVEIPDVEADDVIATLAVMGAQRGIPMIISSLDKDLMQLVEDPLVKMVNTMNNKVYDVAGVQEKFGVHPDQIIDYLALVGDTSDNIPGVPKVGPKTAVKWLNEFKDLEGITQNAENFPGVVGQNLRDSIQDLDRNVELVTLKKDVDLSVSLDELLAATENQEELNKLFASLEFKNWIKSPDGRSTDEPIASAPSKEYETVLSDKALKTWAEKLNKCSAFAIDTETSSLDTMTADLLGISLSCEEGEGCYIPIQHSYEGMPEQLSLNTIVKILGEAISNNQTKLVGQNLKFDLPILNRHGIKVTEFLGDTMLMSYVLNSTGTRHGLDRMAVHYLQYQPMKYEEVAGSASKQINFAQVEIPAATFYAAEDADITFRLFNLLDKKLQKEPKLINLLKTLEYPMLKSLLRVETNGAKINTNMLAEYSKELGLKIDKLSKTAFKMAGEEFNMDSPKQLVEILYNKLELPVLKKTPKGQPSTNEDTLQRLAEEYELPKVIIQYRGLAKLKSTYTDSLVNIQHPDTKRIHTSYQQAVTSTGRLSSTEPNLQNIPIKTAEGRKIREAFVAEKGNVLISADYSQIELRIMAHLSGDKNLTHAFNNNIDVHSATASEIFDVPLEEVTTDHRRSAKAINFGLIYGMSAFGLTRQLGIPRHEAQAYLDTYFERYTGVREYMDSTKELAKKNLYVETILGRKLHVTEINASNGLRRQAAERAAINAPLQGSAADIIKKAMIDVDEWIGEDNPNIKMIMQVHDELIFEVKKGFAEEALENITRLMEDSVKLDIPLIVDANTGVNWNEAH